MAKEEKGREEREIPSAYLLWGPDGPFKDETLDGLLRELLPGEKVNLTLEMVNGAEMGEEVLSSTEMLPLFASRQVIVIRDADRLPPSHRKRILSALERGLPPHLCIIFLVKKMEGKDAFLAALRRISKDVCCEMEGPREIEGWLKERARRRGKGISPQAIQALFESIGSDPNFLLSELDKAILMVGDKREIDAEDIWAQGGKRGHHIFEVVNAIAEGKAREGILGIHSLLESGEDPLGILGMISRHVRLLSKAKARGEEGKSHGEISRELRIPSTYLRPLLSQAPSISWNSLMRLFQELLRIDFLLKSEKEIGRLALERLVMDLCQRRTPIT